MAEAKNRPNAQEIASTGDTIDLRDVPVGANIRLRKGATAEVTANPMDGGWLFVRYVEFPDQPSRVGEDDMAFCTEVLQIL